MFQGKYFDRVKGIKILLNDTECRNLDVSDTILTCDVPDLLAVDSDDDTTARRRRRRQASGDDDKNVISRKVSVTVCCA